MNLFPNEIARMIVDFVVGRRLHTGPYHWFACISDLCAYCKWKSMSGYVYWIDVCDFDKARCSESAVLERRAHLISILSSLS